MRQKLVLHAVELLNDGSFVVVFLDLVIGCYSCFKQWIQQILEDLPKQEEIVALCNQEVHLEEVLV